MNFTVLFLCFVFVCDPIVWPFDERNAVRFTELMREDSLCIDGTKQTRSVAIIMFWSSHQTLNPYSMAMTMALSLPYTIHPKILEKVLCRSDCPFGALSFRHYPFMIRFNARIPTLIIFSINFFVPNLLFLLHFWQHFFILPNWSFDHSERHSQEEPVFHVREKRNCTCFVTFQCR